MQENGQEKWVYESYNTKYKPNPIDSTFFWAS